MVILKNNSVTGIFFNELARMGPFESTLIFGSGLSPLSFCAYDILNLKKMLVYDKDSRKMAFMEEDKRYTEEIRGEKLNITFSDRKPSEKFNLTLTTSTIHEDPYNILKEIVNLTESKGIIGVIDYDMKNVLREDFFKRWGFHSDEKAELEILGEHGSWKMHTRSGLEDCINISESLGVKTVFSSGNVGCWIYHGELPTKHFVYIGKNYSA